MIIEVTQEYIDSGKPNSCYNCPIALAIREKFPDFYIAVYSCNIVINRENIKTSKRMREFIKAFDHQKPVKPSKFRIKIQ